MLNRNELHMQLEKQFHKRVGVWRKYLNSILGTLISKFGFAVTHVNVEDWKARIFVERLGFLIAGERAGIVTYRISEIKLKHRGHICQQ